MRTWYLVRHGETEWNAARRMQGQWDSKLTAQGRAHARQSGRLLAQLGVDAIFASPLGRVRETWAIMSETLHGEAMFDDRLIEWSCGEWSGELYSDLPSRWPTEWAAWEADRYGFRPPGAENFVDLAERAAVFLDHARNMDVERIAIVAHGFINRAIAGSLLSLSPAGVLGIRQHNDTIIRVRTGEVDHFSGRVDPQPGLPLD